MKHVVTCQAKTAPDWLALAALKCFTESVGLCAKEGSAHMAQACHGQPSTTPNVPPNAPAQPRPYLSHVHVGYRCIYRHDLCVQM